MNPTHILVPITGWNGVIQLMRHKGMNFTADDFESYPKVDLSEESVKQRAKDCSGMYTQSPIDYGDVETGYQQAIKDILNPQ